MKTNLAISLVLIFNALHLFATNSLNATYNSDSVKINQFLCYYENVKDDSIDYNKMEEKFYQFYYLAESLLEISNKLESQISFYSENGISQLDIDNKSYLFVSIGRESEVKSSTDEYLVTKDYNNSFFIISYVCNDLKLQQPIKDYKNKNLYSLKLKYISNTLMEEEIDNHYYFFLLEGECQFVPNFKIKGNDYYGFYFSKAEAKLIKNKLQNEHGIASVIKKIPCDFHLINEAYFSLKESGNLKSTLGECRRTDDSKGTCRR